MKSRIHGRVSRQVNSCSFCIFVYLLRGALTKIALDATVTTFQSQVSRGTKFCQMNSSGFTTIYNNGNDDNNNNDNNSVAAPWSALKSGAQVYS